MITQPIGQPARKYKAINDVEMFSWRVFQFRGVPSSGWPSSGFAAHVGTRAGPQHRPVRRRASVDLDPIRQSARHQHLEDCYLLYDVKPRKYGGVETVEGEVWLISQNIALFWLRVA
jgi:hypothetical protein